MKAVILAAGEGRRLEPLTHHRPKPMVPIANQPLLEYVVDAVVAAGIDEIVMVVGYKRERIQSYFENGDDWGVDIEYVVQEKQLGTGHAIRQAADVLSGEFLVLNGDRIIEASIVEQLADEPADGVPLLAVTPVDTPEQYGVVELDNGLVERIAEKPPAGSIASNLINAGVYRFGPAIFDAIEETDPSSTGELAITETLQRLVDDASVRAVRYRGRWLDVSYLWDVVTGNAAVLDRAGPTHHETARIHDRATVAEATAIGAASVVEPNATVLRGTALGDNVRVGPNAVVENTVVFPDVTIDAGAVVRDCILGENAAIGANVTVEGGAADVTVDGRVHSPARFGGVIGDNSHVGGAVAVAPGTVLGDGSRVESGVSLAGRFPTGVDVRRG